MGRPLLPEIVGQTDRVGAKSLINGDMDVITSLINGDMDVITSLINGDMDVITSLINGDMDVITSLSLTYTFTALHGMQTGSGDKNSVDLSFCLTVSQTRAL